MTAAQHPPLAPDDEESPEAPGSPPRRAARSSRRRWLIEWLVILVVALAAALAVKTWVVQAFYIPSGSMIPTLQVGDRILVDKLSYDFHSVHRGDMVVFRRPARDHVDPNIEDLVKRVVGLPGDVISSAPDGHVLINGRPLAEPYLPVADRSGPGAGPPIARQVVPPGHYFVMGDNRADSYDSRFFGPIRGSLIVGRVEMRIWPLSALHIF